NRWMSVPEVFRHSSNIGTVRLFDRVGIELQRKYLKSLGMFEPVQIEMPERGRPMLPDPWRPINGMTISYGHGMAVTPLHMVRAQAAMVNGRMLLPLTLLKEGNGKVPSGTRVVKEETSGVIRALMRDVVARGTGKKSD